MWTDEGGGGFSPYSQVDPKLAKRKDDDGRLPIHWAASSNQLDIVQLLAEQKGFEVDVQVRYGEGCHWVYYASSLLTRHTSIYRMTWDGRHS